MLCRAVGHKKQKGKGPMSKGKASIEAPNDSPAAQEQHKLTAKQRKKAEKDVSITPPHMSMAPVPMCLALCRSVYPSV